MVDRLVLKLCPAWLGAAVPVLAVQTASSDWKPAQAVRPAARDWHGSCTQPSLTQRLTILLSARCDLAVRQFSCPAGWRGPRGLRPKNGPSRLRRVRASIIFDHSRRFEEDFERGKANGI